jgi:hypothetical protein
MTNALEEFKGHVGSQEIICVSLYCYVEVESAYLLRKDYTPEDFKLFLQSLNFEYDSNYTGQQLYGTIWYADGAWSSRGEYAGYDHWQHNIMPDIPNELLA